jgi:RNA polymerase sigma factor (sigma-70 family)
MRLVTNHCIDTQRAEERRSRGTRPVEGEDASGPTADSELCHFICPAQDALQGELGRAIALGIAALPPRLAESARRFFLEDQPYSEIAEELQTSAANIRKRIQEARSLLKEALHEFTEPAHRR